MLRFVMVLLAFLVAFNVCSRVFCIELNFQPFHSEEFQLTFVPCTECIFYP